MSSVYGVFRVQKIKCSNGGGLAARLKHSTREIIAENIDENRSVYNSVEGANSYAKAKKESKDTDKARHYGVDWRVFTFYVGGIVRLKQS